ncbi:MAG: type II toxin-antitoxin system prevent-host-death family antitoxin [Patescibacteria group bacterium]
MDIAIPFITTVADLQRGYRSLVDKIKETGELLLVVNNGKPDVVVMSADVYSAKALRLKELEEEYSLRIFNEAIAEYKAGKTVWLKKGQKLSDIL